MEEAAAPERRKAVWSLRLLDHFALRGIDGDVGLTARKAIALIIYLALQRDRIARRDVVANLLWSGVDTVQGRVNLRQAIAAIRRVEGPAPLLEAEADTVALTEAVEIDVEEFQRLAVGTPADRAAAADLYRTDLVAGFALRDEPGFNEWLTIAQSHWRQRAIEVLLSVSDGSLDAGGDTNAGITAALKLLSIDPYNEAAHRTLMRLYSRQGRAALALAQYRALADTLRRELQVAPDAETQELYQRIKGDRLKSPSTPAPAPSRSTVAPPTIAVAVPSPEMADPDYVTVDAAAGEDRSPPREPARIGKRRQATVIAAILVVLLGGGWLAWTVSGREADRAPGIARVYPIATSEGDERAPALSPDGTLVVYSERRGDNVDLYMTALEGGSEPVRLTTHPDYDSGAIWRPDGRAIAFVRQSQRNDRPCTIVIRPMPIGSEREVGGCLHSYSTQLAWAADGRTIYFSDDASPDQPYRLHAVAIDSGAVRSITTVEAGILGDYAPAVSHDGRQIAYQHRAAAASQLRVQDLATGAVTNVRSGIAGLYSIAWSKDDRGLFYSVVTGPDAGLWWIPADADAAPTRLSSGLTRYAGLSASASGLRLAVQVSNDRGTLFRLRTTDTSLSNATTVTGLDATGLDHLAVQGRDGRIAFVSTRTGSEQLWIMRPGESAQPLMLQSGTLFTWLDWSPNGRILAAAATDAAGRSSVLLIDVVARKVRRVVNSDAAHFPAWSGDGRYLYWTSLCKDRPALVRIALAHPGTIEHIMEGAFGVTRFSADGRYLYYTSGGQPGLRRRMLDTRGMPVGTPQIVVPDLAIYYYDNWVLTDNAILYPRRSPDGSVGLLRRNLSEGTTTEIGGLTAEQASPTLSMANDGAVFVRRTIRQNDITGMDFD